MSPAEIAELLRQGIVAGNPTVPLSLTDDNMDAVVSEISKFQDWNCSTQQVAESLGQLIDSYAPQCPCGPFAASPSTAHSPASHTAAPAPYIPIHITILYIYR